MPGKLYIIPTPIGNLEDITLRAIRILGEVDLILAEDTRQSIKLLNHYELSKPMRSFHQHNEHQALAGVVAELNAGKQLALISDAGTPGISDPGFLLVRECQKNGIDVECLPGATAFVPALVKSGLPSDSFVFAGFLPEKKGRNTAIQNLSVEQRTVILYESPHRLLKTLAQLSAYFGAERRASISRELSKLHEETINGSMEELHAHFSKQQVKGEFVIVIAGKK